MYTYMNQLIHYMYDFFFLKNIKRGKNVSSFHIKNNKKKFGKAIKRKSNGNREVISRKNVYENK